MKTSFFDYTDFCRYLVLNNREGDLYRMLRTLYPNFELNKLKIVVEFLFENPVNVPDGGSFDD